MGHVLVVILLSLLPLAGAFVAGARLASRFANQRATNALDAHDEAMARAAQADKERGLAHEIAAKYLAALVTIAIAERATAEELRRIAETASPVGLILTDLPDDRKPS